LKSFQLENVQQLGRLDVGATFSVPGAGKTTEALAFFTLRRKPNSVLFVVAPKNAFAAWEEQLALCLPKGLKFERLTGGRAGVETLLQTKPTLMLATYHLFPNIDDIIERYLADKDSFVFLDESHRIKGGSSKVIAASILKLSTVARGRLIMTGTPLPNSISDLIPQLSFIDPGTKANDDTVSKLIQPLYVRTTKKQLDLPELNRVPCIVPLAPAQRQLYDLMRSEAARQAEDLLTVRSRMAFRRIGRSALSLIQFIANPALFSKKPFAHDLLLGAVLDEGDSPKLTYACTRARRLAREGRKVIIWSSFVENVELIADRLADIGADFIHGGVEASNDADANSREAKIRRFHDDKNAMVLVANSR
jgi:SNF2 family DNA or RNA helicase